MPQTTSRLADPEDFRELQQLNLAALALDPSAFGVLAAARKNWTDEEWQDYIQSGRIQMGVNQHGQMVAMAGAKPKGEGVWQLHSVYVDPEHRREVDERSRRLGERLLADLLETLREEGATQVDLIVNQKQTAAIALYERLGFTKTGELHDHPSADGGSYSKFLMTKRLEPPKTEELPLAA